jgi:hypothetical protein
LFEIKVFGSNPDQGVSEGFTECKKIEESVMMVSQKVEKWSFLKIST